MSFSVTNNGHTLRYKGSDVILHKDQDITKFRGDFIVNAAKPSLQGGGGVDGAIHRAAGEKLKKKCIKKLKKEGKSKLKVGQTVLTKGYNISTIRSIIHTVGPNLKKHYKNNFKQAKQDLFDTYNNCIKLANREKYVSGAFPGISTGVYKFPKKDAARISLKAIIHEIDKGVSVKQFHLYCNDSKGKSYAAYTRLFDKAIKNGKIG